MGHPDVKKTQDFSAVVEEFAANGFVFCPSFQTDTQIGEILVNLDRVICDVIPTMPLDHVFYEDKHDLTTLKQIQQLQKHDKFFGELMTKGPFRELAERLLRTDVVCQNMQYFNKPVGIGRPTPAHQDGYYFKLKPCEAVTMWLALEPVDHENGCVRYVPGSHMNGMRPHGLSGVLGFSQGITDFPNANDAENEVAFPAQPGDLLAHHALTIHRAGGNDSRTRSRRALGFIYYSSTATEDLAARENYLRELKNDMTKNDRL